MITMKQSAPTPKAHPPKPNRGFTLIELSVVLMIIAVLLGGGLASFVAYTKKRGYEATFEQLAYLETVLQQYREAHGRLPCPADIQDVTTDLEFGKEHGTRGVCEDTNEFQYATDNDVVAGALPVRALGIADDLAFDSWGSRIYYSVDRRFTSQAGFVQYGPTTTGKLTVTLGASGSSAAAVYVLLSHGPNRHGAYPRAGGTIRVSGRDPAAARTTEVYWGWEMENCDCDDGTAASVTFDDTFVQSPYILDPADPNDEFDDIVAFKTRSQME